VHESTNPEEMLGERRVPRVKALSREISYRPKGEERNLLDQEIYCKGQSGLRVRWGACEDNQGDRHIGILQVTGELPADV